MKIAFYKLFLSLLQMRSPKEVQKEEYYEFYKKTFSDFLDPIGYTHFTTEVPKGYGCTVWIMLSSSEF